MVAGKQEEAIVLPLKAHLPFVCFIPDRGETATADHIHRFVDGNLQRRHRLTWWNLGYPRLADALEAGELQERRVAFPLVPPAELDRSHVRHEIPFVDRYASRRHPSVPDAERTCWVSDPVFA